jgi:ribosomal protein S12 methylthiotransferase
VPPELKAERRGRFMALAAKISANRLQAKIGRKMSVLIDRIERSGSGASSGSGGGSGSKGDGDVAIARSASDAPEIDGTVRIEGIRGSATALSVGSMVDVQITAAGDYDLEARLVA